MNKPDLAFNNLQWLICHKTKPTQTKLNQTNKIQYKAYFKAEFNIFEFRVFLLINWLL